jgi:predicted nucleotidyltransferase
VSTGANVDVDCRVKHKSHAKRILPERAELIRALAVELPTLRDRYAVRTLALFGSYARGEARARSDLDLLVEFDRAPSLLKFVQLEQYLSDLVGVKVDLVMKDALKPTIGHQILAELVPL